MKLTWIIAFAKAGRPSHMAPTPVIHGTSLRISDRSPRYKLPSYFLRCTCCAPVFLLTRYKYCRKTKVIQGDLIPAEFLFTAVIRKTFSLFFSLFLLLIAPLLLNARLCSWKEINNHKILTIRFTYNFIVAIDITLKRIFLSIWFVNLFIFSCCSKYLLNDCVYWVVLMKKSLQGYLP